jgi:hypothetical protein
VFRLAGSAHMDEGGSVMYSVFTLRRTKAPLTMSYEALQHHCERFRRKMRVIEKRFGTNQSWRVFEEVFHPERGWHPHLNMFWLLPHGMTNSQVNEFKGLAVKAWLSAADPSHGHVSAKAQSGEHVTTSKRFKTLSNYVFKHAFYTPENRLSEAQSWEKSLNPWDVLDYARTGNPMWIRVWQEYERAMKGRHRVTHFINEKKRS